MRLLLAEDEPELAAFIAKGLREESYAVDVVGDGARALYNAEINSYDLVILDVLLPLMDGFSLCRELRKKSFRAPVLMLTALDDAEDIICGLNCGADDYVTKPFDFRVLLARISVLLRRANRALPAFIQVADLRLNTVDHTAVRGTRSIPLTAKEYELLEVMMLHADEVVGRETISRLVWDESLDPGSNVIDVYVNRLRKKIDQGFDKPLIQTRRGKGFILTKDD